MSFDKKKLGWRKIHTNNVLLQVKRGNDLAHSKKDVLVLGQVLLIQAICLAINLRTFF